MEAYQYSDPVTRFLTALYVNFDFEGAREALGAAEGVLEADFFLGAYSNEFVEAARCLISEAYCRVHHTINIGQVVTFSFYKAAIKSHIGTYLTD